MFKQINLYTVLIQGISTFFTGQRQLFVLPEKFILRWHQNFEQFNMLSAHLMLQ